MDESFMDEIEFSDGERSAEQLACAMANTLNINANLKPNDVTEATNGGVLSPPPCSQSIQVRGVKFLVFDADAKPIHVGDTLEWQETSGPYGQTKRGRGTVTQEMLLYGSIITDGGLVNTHWEWKPVDGPEGWYCRQENHSYDHGHKTWARIISSASATNPTPE